MLRWPACYPCQSNFSLDNSSLCKYVHSHKVRVCRVLFHCYNFGFLRFFCLRIQNICYINLVQSKFAPSSISFLFPPLFLPYFNGNKITAYIHLLLFAHFPIKPASRLPLSLPMV